MIKSFAKAENRNIDAKAACMVGEYNGFDGFGFGRDGSFGPYELRGELGQGAMARVWRAWDPVLGREVAIKEPLFDQVANPDVRAEMAQRFVKEAKVAARLNHPGIVSIYAADVYDGRPAIVMELVQGATLGDILKHGPLAPDAALDVLDQLLDAIGYAHGQGVVHRDIKPDNIFVTSDGRVKLADFGIAHADDGDSRQTVFGAVLGTPGYMSPGQARGEGVDSRNDLFSIGVVAYEMLTGRNPFGVDEGADTNTLIYRTLNEQVPQLADSCVRGLPAGAGPAIMAALAKSRRERPQTAAEFKAMLHDDAASRMVDVDWTRRSDWDGSNHREFNDGEYGEGGENGGYGEGVSGEASGRTSHGAYIVVAVLGVVVLFAMLFGAMSSGGGGGGGGAAASISARTSISTSSSATSGSSATSSSSSAASASSSASARPSSSASQTGRNPESSGLVGTWEVVEVATDGEIKISRSYMDAMHSYGDSFTISLKDDGTASMVAVDDTLYGSWNPSTATTGSIALATQTDSNGTVVAFEHMTMSLSGNQLIIQQDATTITCERAG